MIIKKRFLLIGGFLPVYLVGILFLGSTQYNELLFSDSESPNLLLIRSEIQSAATDTHPIQSEQFIGKHEYHGWVVFPEHLAGAFTGGFGEQTCHSCHFDYDLNMEDGLLRLVGLPQTIVPSNEYELTVEIRRPELGAAGFQLTSRFEDGIQAGTFLLNAEVGLTPMSSDEVQYLQHAIRNIRPDGDTKKWTFTWKAPSDIRSSIYFHLAGNAANGDESAFEDWILIREYVIDN